MPLPICVKPPVPVIAAPEKAVPWATAPDSLMAKVPLLVMALLVERLPPLPSWSVPALMVVAPL